MWQSSRLWLWISLLLAPLMAWLGFSVAQHYTNALPSTVLEGECSKTNGHCFWPETQATFRIESDTISSMNMLPIRFTAPELDSESLTLYLSGVEMYMGLINIPLTRTKDGEYQGEFLLPACTVDSMTWVGQVKTTQERTYRLTFEMAR